MTMKLPGSLLLLLLAAEKTSAFSAVTTTAPVLQPLTPTQQLPIDSLALQDFDFASDNRLPYLQGGYNEWIWDSPSLEGSHKIDYIEMGSRDKPALLLIHGFGASAYHFRHNIPELARDYNVFALDMLGFGLSDKPLVDYNAEVWRDQATAFVKEVIGRECVVAGNSLGGFTALYASTVPDLQPYIKGCVLLNGAGRFRPEDYDAAAEAEEEAAVKNPLVQQVENFQAAFQRLVIQLSFVYTKQPARIEQVLKQVYPINGDEFVDSELVESIQFPSFDPNAAEVFYRVITKTSGQKVYIDDLLEQLEETPLLLCWGEEDPWIRSAAADKIQMLYPRAQRVSINAGHCPHDEDPTAVNTALRNFMKECHTTIDNEGEEEEETNN